MEKPDRNSVTPQVIYVTLVHLTSWSLFSNLQPLRCEHRMLNQLFTWFFYSILGASYSSRRDDNLQSLGCEHRLQNQVFTWFFLSNWSQFVVAISSR